MVDVTISEAAAHIWASEHTIRQWVYREQLTPIRRGAKPLLFRLDDVIECAHTRITEARHRRLDALWQVIVDETPDSV